MVVNGVLLTLIFGVNYVFSQDLINVTFPSTFKFGTASSAYQIEGGWDADGKGLSRPDFNAHNYPFLYLNSTGDVACDSYHKYSDDVHNLKSLGVHFYRFSISWPRILPTGMANQINQAGIDYYLNLLKELKAAGIEPMVTLFHFDPPMAIYELGGFNNPDIAKYFTEYADVCFRYFGDYVKIWSTFNEPQTYCAQTNNNYVTYFSYIPTGFIEYTCGKNILLAHARTYKLYQTKYKSSQQGKISLNLNGFWDEPDSNSTEDIEAALRKTQFTVGWFAHPIYKGNYPQVMIDTIANVSRIQNFSKSRLPELSAAEIEYIKGTSDYFALNHYSTSLVSASYYSSQNVTKPSYNSDVQASSYQSSEWVGDFFTKIVPWGLGKGLKFIKEEYNNPEIMITENGYGDAISSPQNDTTRMEYIKGYLNQILRSIEYDGVNVTYYAYWSLMDSFEWSGGYAGKAGLFRTDFNVENRTRTPKNSVAFYRNIIETRCLLDVCASKEAGSS